MYVVKLSDKTGKEILNLNSNLSNIIHRYIFSLGSTHVTLWGSIGRTVSKYHVGQYIVLEGVRTFKDMNGLTEVVGDTSYGTLIYNGNKGFIQFINVDFL